MITADVPSPYQTVTRFCSNLRPSPFLHPSFLLLVLITTLSLGPLPLPPSPPPRPTIRLFASPAPWPQNCALKAALTSTWPSCGKLCALWSPSLRGLSPPHPTPPVPPFPHIELSKEQGRHCCPSSCSGSDSGSATLSPFLIGRMFLREPSWKYSAKLVGS